MSHTRIAPKWSHRLDFRESKVQKETIRETSAYGGFVCWEAFAASLPISRLSIVRLLTSTPTFASQQDMKLLGSGEHPRCDVSDAILSDCRS